MYTSHLAVQQPFVVYQSKVELRNLKTQVSQVHLPQVVAETLHTACNIVLLPTQITNSPVCPMPGLDSGMNCEKC